MAKKEATPLSVMLGSGEDFFVGGKKYTVKPLKLKHVDEFMKDNLSLGMQLVNITNEEAKSKLDKWLSRQVVDEKGSPMSLEKAMEDDWDLGDLKRCIQRLLDISG